jgi:HD-like signal output (HDOD) protein
VALSGYADQKLIFKIINTNLAKAFLNKPWKENELNTTVRDIIQINERLNNDYVKNIIHSSNKLPTLPEIFKQINDLIEDDTSDLEVIVELINTDQVSASKILKVVNSAIYGVNTGSVKTAVLSLGLVNLKAIIATSELLVNGENHYENLLWEHSSMTNNMTMIIYEYIFKNEIPDIYSTTGLLHDFGKVVLYKIFEKKYERVLRMKEENPEFSLSMWEKNLFNFTHQELGASILNYWELPEPIVEVALNHHDPNLSSVKYKDIVSIVHIADCYSWQIIHNKFGAELKEEVFNYLKVTKEEIEKLLRDSGFVNK